MLVHSLTLTYTILYYKWFGFIPRNMVRDIYKELAVILPIRINSYVLARPNPIKMFGSCLEWVAHSDHGVTPFHNDAEWVVTQAARAAVEPDGRPVHNKPSCGGKGTWLMESCISAGLWLCGEMVGSATPDQLQSIRVSGGGGGGLGGQRPARHRRRLSTAAAVSGEINTQPSLLRGEPFVSDTSTAPGCLSFLCLPLTIATTRQRVLMNLKCKRWENCFGEVGETTKW